MGETVGVGWIGAGSFSRAKLIPALQKISGVRFVGLANATGISAQRAARNFGFGYCCTDANELVDDPARNAVFIGTRHHLHASLVIGALNRCKHVFVEKPLCVNEAELNQIAEAYARSGRILTVGFNRRYSPFAADCTDLFKGRIGPLSMLYRVNAGRLPSGHWVHHPTQGHGRVIGEICHFVDLMGFLSSSLRLAQACLKNASKFSVRGEPQYARTSEPATFTAATSTGGNGVSFIKRGIEKSSVRLSRL